MYLKLQNIIKIGKFLSVQRLPISFCNPKVYDKIQILVK